MNLLIVKAVQMYYFFLLLEEVTSWAVAELSGKCNMWALLGISSCGSAVLALRAVAWLKCFCRTILRSWSYFSRVCSFEDISGILQDHLRDRKTFEINWRITSGFHQGRKLYWHRGRWLNKVVGSEKMQSAVFSSEWRLFNGSYIHVEIKGNTTVINYFFPFSF